MAGLQSVQSRLRSSGPAPTMAQIARTGAAAASPSSRSRAAGSGGGSVNVPAPSASLRSYTSPSGLYRIGVPSNWQVAQEGSTGAIFGPQGGIGNVKGAVLGGLIIGVIQSLSDLHFGPSWTEAVVFAYLIAIMILRPRGLLGEETREAG